METGRDPSEIEHGQGPSPIERGPLSEGINVAREPPSSIPLGRNLGYGLWELGLDREGRRGRSSASSGPLCVSDHLVSDTRAEAQRSSTTFVRLRVQPFPVTSLQA